MNSDAFVKLEKGIRAFSKGNYTLALELLLPLAEAGNAKAQCYLGSMYQGGLGVPVDGQQAVKWFLRAAEQEVDAEHISATAYNNLATIYTTGVFGVNADTGLARGYAETAWRLGFRAGLNDKNKE